MYRERGQIESHSISTEREKGSLVSYASVAPQDAFGAYKVL